MREQSAAGGLLSTYCTISADTRAGGLLSTEANGAENTVIYVAQRCSTAAKVWFATADGE